VPGAEPQGSPKGQALLTVDSLSTGYAGSRVLFGVDLVVPEHGVVALLGRNGAGKTTLLRTLMGYMKPTSGTVTYAGKDVTGVQPTQLARQRVGYVPQEHAVFSALTVRENLVLGGTAAPRGSRAEIGSVLELFPKLADRLNQVAGTMSGGEQKMLGIARALLGQPRLLILDEPTEGVWRGVVEEIADHLASFAREGAVLLVEQNVDIVVQLAASVTVLDRGEVMRSGPLSEQDRSGALAAMMEM